MVASPGDDHGGEKHQEHDVAALEINKGKGISRQAGRHQLPHHDNRGLRDAVEEIAQERGLLQRPDKVCQVQGCRRQQRRKGRHLRIIQHADRKGRPQRKDDDGRHEREQQVLKCVTQRPRPVDAGSHSYTTLLSMTPNWITVTTSMMRKSTIFIAPRHRRTGR